jgi:hypothetical protein
MSSVIVFVHDTYLVLSSVNDFRHRMPVYCYDGVRVCLFGTVAAHGFNVRTPGWRMSKYHRWNAIDRAKPMTREKISPITTLCITNPTWTSLFIKTRNSTLKGFCKVKWEMIRWLWMKSQKEYGSDRGLFKVLSQIKRIHQIFGQDKWFWNYFRTCCHRNTKWEHNPFYRYARKSLRCVATSTRTSYSGAHGFRSRPWDWSS